VLVGFHHHDSLMALFRNTDFLDHAATVKDQAT
jgi:hypothetical protein